MKILNIGSGPVTPGTLPGLEIINADRREYPDVQIEDMEDLSYPDSSFDLVVCINALDHTKDAEAAIQEMIRVSKQWVYIDCALIQRTTSGKNHCWDAFEDGVFMAKDECFNIKKYGFDVEFINNGGEKRYDHIICRYTKQV